MAAHEVSLLVLVIEDNPITRKLLKVALSSEGYTVREAPDGKTALHIATTDKPALIIQDLRLPDMDGIELVAALRGIPGLHDIPILAFSGLQSKMEEARSLRAGFTDFLFKPVEPSRLVRVVNGYIRPQPAAEEGGTGILPPAVPSGDPAVPAGDGLEEGGTQEGMRRQLEQQIALNHRLVHQASVQAAQAAVLAGVAEALSRVREPQAALHEILARILDATGASAGAIFLAAPEGSLQLGASIGSEAGGELADFYGHPELLARTIRDASVLLLPSPEAGERGGEVLRRAGARAMILVPLQAPDRAQGVMVLNTERAGLGGWVESLSAIASQLGQSVLLARTLERLAESEERYHGLFRRVPTGLYRVSLEGHFVEANPAMQRLLGYHCLADLFSTRMPDVHADETGRDEWRRITGEDRGAPWYEARMRRADGSVIWVRHSVRLIRTDAGLAAFYEGSAEDITERHDAEEARQRDYDLLHAIIESTPDPIFVKDLSGRYLLTNSASFALLGASPEAVVGHTDAEILEPERANAVRTRDLETLRLGNRSDEVELEAPDGPRTFLTTRTVLRDAGGRTTGLFGIAREITERKRAEVALAERAGAAALVADVGLALTKAEALPTTLQRCTEAAVRHLGAAFARIWVLNEGDDMLTLQASAGMYTHLDGAHSRIALGQCKIGRIAAEKRPHVTNTLADDPQVTDKDWARREGIVGFAGYPLVVEGRIAGVFGMFSRQVISQSTLMALGAAADEIALGILRKHSENALAESEARFRELAGNVREVFFVQNRDLSRLEYVNPSYERVWGVPVASLYDDPMSYLTPVVEGDRDALQQAMRRSQAGELLEDIQFRIRRPDGAIRWIRLHATPVKDARGVPQRIVGVAADVTEQRQAEEALRASEAQYRLLFDAHPSPMWVYDLETLKFRAVNTAAEQHYGFSRSDFLSMTIKDIHPADDIPRLLEVLASGGVGAKRMPDTWRHRRKDGSIIEVEVTGSALTFGERPAELVLAQDITARRRLEDQFRQAQKMEAVGRLAGGVAHDFNNLLTAIMGYTELLLLDMSPADPRREELSEILESAERAASLTRQLLAFSRQQVLEPRVLDLNEVITQLSKMLHRLLGEDIDLTLHLAPDLTLLRADASQMEQVLVNLAVNARDAMPQGGQLTIETWNQEVDAAPVGSQQPLRPGRYAVIAVSDTGTGMTEEVKRRLFEPFFTTKEEGKGTGLGLSTVYGIVTQTGGQVLVYSEVGHGTTFKIYLAGADSPPEAVATEAGTNLRQSGRGSETILLVEDETAVRKLAGDVLARQGYEVLVCSHAEEALQVAAAHPGSVDLLITDVVMPGLRGPELAARLLAERPGCRVLYVSGYAPEAAVRQGMLAPGQAFLAKPFGPAVLARKVREVLDRQAEAQSP